MAGHESPYTAFEVLYTRWPAAPKVVVYDNGCHAHVYTLNRGPAWAKDTLFLIDKLHAAGHTGCCKAYDVTHHPSLGTLNSQLAEQKVCMFI